METYRLGLFFLLASCMALHAQETRDPFHPMLQDGNELTFGTPCTGCTLQLLDSTGEVVYETTIASGTTIVNLPSASLLGGSGTYELRLIFGDYYFYGDISL